MMIQNELLNDAEKYMKDNDLKLFMKYIIEQTGITFEVGDFLSVLMVLSCGIHTEEAVTILNM